MLFSATKTASLHLFACFLLNKQIFIASPQTDSDIDIESIPVPAPALHRKAASFSNYHGRGRQPPAYLGNGSIRKTHFDNLHSLKAPKATKSKFKIMNLLKLPKNKITSIDISQLNNLNATVKKICNGGNKKKSERKKMPNGLAHPFPSHSVECKVRKGQHLEADRLPNGNGLLSAMGSSRFLQQHAEPMGLHASNCELVLSRASDLQHFPRDEYLENSATNLKYCSLLSNKQNKKHNGQLQSTYYNFEDADIDFNDRDNGNALDANLLTDRNQDPLRLPWKHRRCPSVVSSSSGASVNKWDPSKHWLAVTSILLIAGAAGVAVPLALRVSSGKCGGEVHATDLI